MTFYPNAYYHLPIEYWEDDGSIEVYKKDTDGKALAGAVFIATETTTGQQYRIGPTDSTGYAKSEMPIPYGEYKIVESVFPTNYRAYGTTSWTKTLIANKKSRIRKCVNYARVFAELSNQQSITMFARIICALMTDGNSEKALYYQCFVELSTVQRWIAND